MAVITDFHNLHYGCLCMHRDIAHTGYWPIKVLATYQLGQLHHDSAHGISWLIMTQAADSNFSGLS